MTSEMILSASITYAQIALGVAACLVGWRLLKGPRAQDRVLALDTLYVNGMLTLIVTGIRTGSQYFFEGSLVIAVLGFVATVAAAKFLIRGEVIE